MTKKGLVFSVIILILAINCAKDKDASYNAIIVGYDNRECVCCGGLMITFSDNPAPYASDYYIIDNLPPNSGISENSTFPLYVSIIWKLTDKTCGEIKFIDIKGISIRKDH